MSSDQGRGAVLYGATLAEAEAPRAKGRNEGMTFVNLSIAVILGTVIGAFAGFLLGGFIG